MEISPSGAGWTSKRQGNSPCMARDNRRAFANAAPDGEKNLPADLSHCFVQVTQCIVQLEVSTGWDSRGGDRSALRRHAPIPLAARPGSGTMPGKCTTL